MYKKELSSRVQITSSLRFQTLNFWSRSCWSFEFSLPGSRTSSVIHVNILFGILVFPKWASDLKLEKSPGLPNLESKFGPLVFSFSLPRYCRMHLTSSWVDNFCLAYELVKKTSEENWGISITILRYCRFTHLDVCLAKKRFFLLGKDGKCSCSWSFYTILTGMLFKADMTYLYICSISRNLQVLKTEQFVTIFCWGDMLFRFFFRLPFQMTETCILTLMTLQCGSCL